jgi:hypothetical protein
MKKIISLALLIFAINFIAQAQTKGNAKIYGYVQSVSGGASPNRSEPPELQNNKGAGNNYYIYLALGTASRIYPSEIWIKGDLYGVQTKPIKKTPVVMESEVFAPTEERILVPKTTQKVTQLIPVASNGEKTSAKRESLAKSNDVVVVYKLAGKFYYATLKSLTSLQNAAMQ